MAACNLLVDSSLVYTGTETPRLSEHGDPSSSPARWPLVIPSTEIAVILTIVKLVISTTVTPVAFSRLVTTNAKDAMTSQAEDTEASHVVNARTSHTENA
ncbi:hypothetical protein LTS18_004557 [Coniosporium uncinatum]|uniref:Uncharacterized protein n=1 Tax=Coniosporium uncinatum TaxID=93489 RepID=A0ACC3DS25_9PEZI|nr:hypothetical protein LTS18_004557 [Coniosporium uncinatum]